MLTNKYHNPTLLATTDSHTLARQNRRRRPSRDISFHARQLTRLLREQASDAVSRAEWARLKQLEDHRHVALCKWMARAATSGGVMAETNAPIRQKLYKHQALGRHLCTSCNDCQHKYCEGYECTCPCRDECKPRVRVHRDRNGLSKEEREAQHDFPFDQHQPFSVKAGPLHKPENTREK